jgi:AcrR family transcriptional regulator
MLDERLTKELILDTAEAVLRKFGPVKTNVSDVARALGVSHAALYRHYDNKSSLRNAVVERWLNVSEPILQAIVDNKESQDKQLYHWLTALRNFKRERALNDPELFEMYAILVNETKVILESHVNFLLSHLTQIIDNGVKAGVFKTCDAHQTARAIYLATSRFHHPSHSAEWSAEDNDECFESVWRLCLHGIVAGA